MIKLQNEKWIQKRESSLYIERTQKWTQKSVKIMFP